MIFFGKIPLLNVLKYHKMWKFWVAKKVKMAVKSMNFHTVNPVLLKVYTCGTTLHTCWAATFSYFYLLQCCQLHFGKCVFFLPFFKCLPSSGNTDLCPNLKAVTWRLNSWFIVFAIVLVKAKVPSNWLDHISCLLKI